MKKNLTLLSFLLMFGAFTSKGQIFWVENFEGGSTTGALASAYSGPNGAWSVTSTGTEDSYHNEWFVSCAENGHTAGVCGTACAAVSSTATLSTLHVGGNPSLTGDAGASYNAGGLCSVGICVITNRRAESPTINCSGKTGITMSFYYIENGDGTQDDASIYYYDGTTWAPLVNPAKTSVCSGGQGQWTRYTYALPASANNNANVKLGFLWVNNDDANGTDPSFAIDSLALSSTGTTTTAPVASFTINDTTVCQDSCITFTSTSTGTVDSVRWRIPGVTISSPTTSITSVCFTNSGYYTVHLYAYHGTAVDSTTHTVHILVSPHPAFTAAGHVLTVTGTYTSYQWYRNGAIISGATNNNYTYTTGGNFQIRVDSGGCQGMSVVGFYNLGVAEISGNGTRYSVTQPDNNSFALYASALLDHELRIQLFDATGRLLLEDNWQAGSDKKQVQAGDVSNGLYIIRLGNSTNSAVLKWLKQ